MFLPLDSASVDGLVAAVDATMLALALAASAATAGLLLWTLRRMVAQTPAERPREDRRRPPQAENRDPREALALVGDALAATHNPRVLLPIILEVIAEATGAAGGPR